MISAVSNRMAMSRSFWNRKVVLFFAQFVPGLVHGSAVCRPGPNQATAHGKGHPGRPRPVRCRILPVRRNVDGIDRERACLDLGHGFLVHIGIGALAPAAIAVQDGIQLPCRR